MNDLKFALRQLLKNPSFSAVAVLTLALGIGASASLFTAVNTILLKPLAAREPGRLVYLASGREETFSFPFYQRLSQSMSTLEVCAAVQYRAVKRQMRDSGADEGTDSIPTQAVSGNFFVGLGVPALLGRTLIAEDDRPGASEPAAVISHALWQRRFAGAPSVIGRSVRLDDVPLTIVGVMPAEFSGFQPDVNTDVWWPLHLAAQIEGPNRRPLAEGVTWLVLFGRLRAGISSEQALIEGKTFFRNEMEDLAKSSNGSERERILNRSVTLHSGAAGYVGARSEFKQPLIILMAAIGLVLLIAASNIAGLLLARGAARQREFAVRSALGAGRQRIARQLVTESLLLALLGGALGLVFAQFGTRFLANFLAQSSAPVALHLDARVLLFTIGISLVIGLLFGLAPAWRVSRLDLAEAIKTQGGGVVSPSRGRLQPLLVIAQVAISVLLLAGAGLFVRTLHNLRTVDLGFQRENLVSLAVGAERWQLNPAQMTVLQKRLLTEFKALPGVQNVSIGAAGLLSGNGIVMDFSADGYEPSPGEEMRGKAVLAGPQFFETLRVPLLSGRQFTQADEPVSSPDEPAAQAKVAILGETMARKYFGAANPVGRHIVVDAREKKVRLEIIGVAADTKYSNNLRDETPLEFYIPYFGSGLRMPASFYIRSEQSAAVLGSEIRRILVQIDPRITIRSLLPIDEMIGRLLLRERIIAQLVSFFSLFALLLACLGVYGILSFRVTRQTREIGLRMALGATLRSVVLLVLRQGLALVVIGAFFGLAAALVATRFVAALLYGVTPADPFTFAAVLLLLGIVAFVASWWPARRAARVDPMEALRAD